MHTFAGAGARGVSGFSLGACCICGFSVAVWFIVCGAVRIVDVRSFSCLLVYGCARRAGCVMVCVGDVLV